MFGIAIVIAIVVILGLVFNNPKLGPIFLWPMLFTYPHFYMVQKQLMPLNIGVDDLFMIVFFLSVVFRRNLLEGVRPRFGFAFWCVFIFCIIMLFTNINSYMALRDRLPEFIKAVLKSIITLMLVYSLLNTIDNLDDLKRSAFIFCFSAALGGIIVIAQNFFPGPMLVFAFPRYVEQMFAGYEGLRPCGAFLNSNNAALVMGSATFIIASTFALKSRYFNKSLRLAAFGVLVIAILMTRSRAGFLSLAGPLCLMGLIGKQRHYTIMFMIVIAMILISLPVTRAILIDRFTGAGTSGGGMMWSLQARYMTGVEHWRNITFSRFLFGRSHYADVLLGFDYPHSFYQGLILSYGIIGTIWTVWLVAMILHKAKAMVNCTNIRISTFGRAIRWSLLSFAVFGVAAGIFDNIYGSYALFLLTVIGQRGVDFIHSYESLYNDEIYIEHQKLTTETEDFIATAYSNTGPIQ